MISHLDKPAFIYHFGDFDPSGVNAAETIERDLRELAPGVEIHFERVAVTLRADRILGPSVSADQGK